MTVEPLPTVVAPSFEPDVPLANANDAPTRASSFSGALENALSGAGNALERAGAAEHAFVAGRGGLQEMMLERAQADVALSIAGAAASRVAQSLTTILGMQV